jgi:glycine/D-amino acid oxidase-like deaminating enzyme
MPPEPTTPPGKARNIIVIGGGIIGTSCAYYLSTHPSFRPSSGPSRDGDGDADTITLLEASSIAGGASGKAGGLLALWAYPQCIVPLSFRLHEELAAAFDGAKRWGYRKVECGQVEAVGRTRRDEKSKGEQRRADKEAVSLQKLLDPDEAKTSKANPRILPQQLDWLDPDAVRDYTTMAGTGETAQVHPYQFTTALAELAEANGVRIVYGSALTLNLSGGNKGRITGVTYAPKDARGDESRILPCDTVVLAAGPWTPNIWPEAPIEALRAHSVVIRPQRDISAYTLFTEISLPRSSSPQAKKRGRGAVDMATPEIYPRPDGTVYACGAGDTLISLPPSSDIVQVDESRCQDVLDQVASISSLLHDGQVLARQACYLPNVRSSSRGGPNGPILGQTSREGLFLAVGHTCWGIQNSVGTGKVVAEMVWEGKASSADVSTLDPKRWGL